jgi:enamine deaminase RidA (YjgF/YER057c/UK114 family)
MVGNLYGEGADAYEQTQAMFLAAEALLANAGLSFSDVMRTWIYLPAMERDYDGFNRARREFFRSRNVDPIPASTGIGAGLASAEHTVSLGLYATKGPATRRSVMTTPTLNEAPEYGSDFSRGMRVVESNRRALFVSGTASLNETGATVYLDDLEAQTDRMLLNVASLLEEQGSGFSDIVAAVTYVKRPEDAPALRARLAAAGYEGFPNLIVHAPVCRPELLCETEALAVVPIGQHDFQGD